MMGRTRNLLRFLVLTGVLLALSAASLVGAQDMKSITISAMTAVETIDPGLAETTDQIQVINQIFMGLTMQDVTNGNPTPGIATGYEVSEDGLTYTFTLMDNVPWVRYNADTDAVEQLLDDSGNPMMVTAEDVRYGILRSLNPETASPYSYVLVPYIVGAEAYNAGEGSADDVQVSAPDATTLVIVAPEAVSFAPSIYGLWMARPVPAAAIEAGGDVWTDPENIATNGPYALAEYTGAETGNQITLRKNPFWPGTASIPQANIDEVVIRLLDPDQQFAEYQAGTITFIQPPSAQLDVIRADGTLSQELLIGTNPCTYYVGFDNTEEPVTNVNLRRALSLAVDRVAIVENVTRGGQIPAQWFARPGLAAAPTPEEYPDLGITYDPAAAQAALSVALEELGLASVTELPQLTLSYNDRADHAAIMQAIQQMWTDTLGITVQLNALESATYFSSVSEEAPMMYRSGWCQDYPDANNFLFDVFYSQSSQNDPGFQNAEFDALVEEARLETDLEAREALYVQAEEILVDQQAGIIPIYWYTQVRMVKPELERVASVTGTEAYYLWDIAG
jgi:oligopeptide transport system substrate-binding protein